ncbi:unnamed protein product [Paramecium primaurelia]|uniref:Selenoprotein T n=1 Tax=Paramecium primaurelia TaxID=5886 RepID=A0A8S1NZU7_PARPR|nr:unnamed protein product [Paramecium primaurelia]
MLVNCLTYIQYGSLIVLVLFDSILSNKISLWQQYISPHKMRAGIMIFIGFNFIIQNLQSTGAFEVTINGQLVHSKLTTGQMPTVKQISDFVSSIV